MEHKPANGETVYKLPTHRWIENGHIFLWLLKDTCWALGWKPGGIFMIFPTLSVALYILYKSRHYRAEFVHNLAICLWISANSVWMLSEFFKVEQEYKQYAVYIFFTGIAILVIYYIFFFGKDRKKEEQLSVKMNN